MKLQGLAILFIILILPLSIIIGEYASFQIETFRLERLYDSRLITATHDAIKTYQINTFNDELSDIVNNKLETIEASATTFYNSLRSGFAMQGYTAEELQQYVPALVYTMYDGYYIYSPYTDVAKIGVEDFDDTDETNNVDVLQFDKDGEGMTYGFKPYVYYSCRYYIDSDNDFVINYTLDNYITISGIVNREYVNKSGHLVTLAGSKDEEGLYRYYDEATGIYTFYYSGQEILPEDGFEDHLVVQEENAEGEMVSTTKAYKYIKINGEKYYYEPDGNTDGDDIPDKYFFHLVGGQRVIQVGEYSDEFYKYISQMELNRSAINYYRNAYEFTTWINKNLGGLTPFEAQSSDAVRNTGNNPIFTNKNIEYSNSDFNLHRKEVIRHSIESNLSIAIANYNKYSNAGANVNFQMPKLKETEWEMLENEISVISFLQGLNIGGKIYNGYTVVTNNKNEEFVDEESIYITTNDGYYNKINDLNFQNEEFANKAQQGVLDLDFETRRDGPTKEYYIPKKGLASYSSVVGQEKLNTKYDTIYEYLQETTIPEKVKNIYYTALARERWTSFKLENPTQVPHILNEMAGVYDYLPITETEKTNPDRKIIVTDGLIRYYDGLNIDGKKNTTITSDGGTSKLMTVWKDLSGHHDGIMMDGVFGDSIPDNGLNTYSNGYVNFEGVDHSKDEGQRMAEGDWVNLGQIKDLKNVTLEAVFSLNDNNTGYTPKVNYFLISNKNGDGGISLYVNKSGNICFSIQNSGEQFLELYKTIEPNVTYHVVAVYDGNKMSIYLKNMKTNEVNTKEEEKGISIKNPIDDTVMALGVDPDGKDGTKTNWGWANIKMYTARIYNKALTEDQIAQNVSATKIGSNLGGSGEEPEIDVEAPQIAITPNGGSTASNYNVTITVTDSKSAIDNSTLMYRITKPSTTPSDLNDKQFFSGINGGVQFSNGQTVQIQGTVGSQYVLWVYAEDINGNGVIAWSEVFTIK